MAANLPPQPAHMQARARGAALSAKWIVVIACVVAGVLVLLPAILFGMRLLRRTSGDWQPEAFSKDPSFVRDLLIDEFGEDAELRELHLTRSSGQVQIRDGRRWYGYSFWHSVSTHDRSRLDVTEDEACVIALSDIDFSVVEDIVPDAMARDPRGAGLDRVSLQCGMGGQRWVIVTGHDTERQVAGSYSLGGELKYSAFDD